MKNFTSRQIAVRRIWQAVARLAPDVAPQATTVAPPEAKSKKALAKPKNRATVQKSAIESRTNKKRK